MRDDRRPPNPWGLRSGDDAPRAENVARGENAARAPRGQDDAAKEQSLLPALALPKGGGAIRGIGETFRTDSATGTVSLQVPIAVSPGRNGFGPKLTLDYDSGAGNGPFGMGWRLSTPSITRKTEKGLPRYLDDSDTFILSGAEDLVPVRDAFDRGDYRVQRYRPRVDGLHARIERWTHRATRDVHWRATTRDNVSTVYGLTPAARIVDPEDSRRVFSWLIEETRDDRGNVCRYGYKAEDGVGVPLDAVHERGRFAHDAGGAPRFVATAQRYLLMFSGDNGSKSCPRGSGMI